MTNKIQFKNGGTWSCGNGYFSADLKAIRLLRQYHENWEQMVYFSDSNYELIDGELYGFGSDKEEGGIWGRVRDYDAEEYYDAEHHNNDVFELLQSWEKAQAFIDETNEDIEPQEQAKFSVTFTGFDTEEQARVFAQWYSGSAEQDTSWLEEHTDLSSATIDSDKVDYSFPVVNGNIDVPLQMIYKETTHQNCND